jgi:hypothetical protein
MSLLEKPFPNNEDPDHGANELYLSHFGGLGDLFCATGRQRATGAPVQRTLS